MNIKLDSAVNIVHIKDLIEHARLSPPGAFVEVGVYKGGTASWLTELAREQNRSIYLYDTFEGIPYQGQNDWHKVGDFNDTDYLTVKNSLPYAEVIKGIFPASAVPMSNIAFLHLDCDQYQSVIDSLDYCLELMVPGGIIWFDDVPCQNHLIGHGRNGADIAVRERYGSEPGLGWQLSPTGKAIVRISY
jgi:O-methyltransferase